MRKCRKALGEILPHLDGVVISHLHSDHIHYSSLRVLEACGVPVYIYEKDISVLAGRHFRRLPFLHLKLRPFRERTLQIGDLAVTPFGVPHDGSRHTFGFQVSAPHKKRSRKIVLATDFWDWRNLTGWFQDSDFIYVEANHDPKLLQEHPNPRSRYHLSNEGCGRLLQRALSAGKSPASGIMLGHLSAVRNRPKLAREKVLELLERVLRVDDVEVQIAPRYEPSHPVMI